jgi:hypothetical protein
MDNFKVLWTDTSGSAHVSVVSYDKTSAERRADELRVDMPAVSVVQVFPPNWTVEVAERPKGRVVQRKHTVK